MPEKTFSSWSGDLGAAHGPSERAERGRHGRSASISRADLHLSGRARRAGRLRGGEWAMLQRTLGMRGVEAMLSAEGRYRPHHGARLPAGVKTRVEEAPLELGFDLYRTVPEVGDSIEMPLTNDRYIPLRSGKTYTVLATDRLKVMGVTHIPDGAAAAGAAGTALPPGDYYQVKLPKFVPRQDRADAYHETAFLGLLPMEALEPMGEYKDISSILAPRRRAAAAPTLTAASRALVGASAPTLESAATRSAAGDSSGAAASASSAWEPPSLSLDALADLEDDPADAPLTIPGSPVGKILPMDREDPPISHKDVYQSNISDCYLQATMIAVAHTHPEQITRMFTQLTPEVVVRFPDRTTETRPDGSPAASAVEVRMSRDLYLTEDGSPLYGGRKERYLWPAFLQKAWAIYKSGYASLPMGRAFDFMTAITGEATTGREISIDAGHAHAKANEAWRIYDYLMYHLTAGHPVLVQTSSWTDRKWRKGGGALGLPSTHRTMPAKADHGGIGILHCYGVMGIDRPSAKRDPRSPGAFPTSRVILRDPRNEEGETFTITLEELADKRKFGYFVSMGTGDREEGWLSASAVKKKSATASATET